MPILTNIGKKLNGEGAGTYLPFALSKLRYFASTKQVIPFSRTIQAEGVTITLELMSPTSGQITITAGGFDYEFTSPGGLWSPAVYAGVPTTLAYAVKVRVTGKTFTPKATGSTAEKSPTDAWPYSENVIDIAAKFIPHKQIWQIQHTPAHVYYASVPDKLVPTNPRKLTAASTLADSWTSATETTNLAVKSRSGTVFPQNDGGTITVANFQAFDIVYDIGPTLFKQDLFPEKNRGLVPDSDWYKRGAVKVVKHPEFGERTFMIMTDVTNKFYAYPVVTPDLTLTEGSPYLEQLIKTNIPADYVKSQAAPFPGWVKTPLSAAKARDWYLANPSDGSRVWGRKYLTEYPQYRWSFNSLGTRAVSIVYYEYPEMLGMDNTDEPQPGDDANIGQKIGVKLPDGSTWYIREALPGLVEMEITLDIIGPNPEDFEFSVGLKQAIDPDAQDVYIFAADYSWGKRPGGPANGTTMDDLITMQLEVYPCGEQFPVPRPDGSFPDNKTVNEQANIVLKNQTTSAVLKTFVQSRTYFYEGDFDALFSNFKSEYYRLKFLAYDLRTLAFMTEALYLNNRIEGSKRVEHATKKLEVSVYGEAEPAIYLSKASDMNAKMDAFAARVDISTMTRLGPKHTADLHAHTVDPDTGAWHYTYAVDPLTRCMEWRFSGDLGTFGENRMYHILSGDPDTIIKTKPMPRTFYNFGASRYATIMDDTLICGVHATFSVHPEGHWAVASPVVVLYDGEIKLVGSGYSPIELDKVRQDFVDIIAVNAKAEDGKYEFKRTTHVEMFNKAYDKTLTKESRFWVPTFTGTHLKMTHPYDTSYFFQFPYDNALGFTVSLPTLDPRHSFFLRGSSIFFGQANPSKSQS